MELDESAWKWLVIGAIAAIFLSHRAISTIVERRRRAWVDSLAMMFGATAAHGPDATSRFELFVDGRRCEVAHGYRSRTMDGRYLRGSQLIVTIFLSQVSDIYNLSFHPRDRERTPESLSVSDHGYHPRDGWLTEALRGAIFDFYDAAGDRAPLHLAGGALTYVAGGRISAETFRAMVERQFDVAAKVEIAL